MVNTLGEENISHVTEDMIKLKPIEMASNDHLVYERTDVSFIYDYIQRNKIRYEQCHEVLKSGAVKIKDNEIANKLFGDIYGEFKNRIDTVEIFNTILVYFGFNEKEYFDILISGYKVQLVKDLSKRVDLGDKTIEIE